MSLGTGYSGLSGATDGSSVTATLTKGVAGSSSVPLTLALSAGAILVSWSVQRRKDGGVWSTIASGLTDLEYEATGLDSESDYDFQADVVVQEAVTSNVVAVATEEAPPGLPVLENRTYAVPGGLFADGASINGGESRLLCLRPPGIYQAFAEYEILVLNPRATTYSVLFAAVGNRSASALTENPATGFVTLINTPTTVPAGDGAISSGKDSLRPGVLSLGRRALPMSGGNGLQLAIELSAGAPRQIWGGNAIGYEPTLNKIPRSLSAGWDISGGQESFGVQPCIAVIYYGLASDMVTLPFDGDSWTRAFGDNDQPYPGAVGVPYRLEQRWRTAGVRIAPINMGRDGLTTAQIAARAAWIIDTFAPRCMARQYYSINNDMQSVGNASVESDFASTETALGPQPLLPLILAGNNVGTSGWWAPVKALEDACKISRPETIDLSAPIINAADGTILTGYNYVDSHPNNAAYSLMESTAHAAILAWCEAKAGASL
jgi:hypothetical protein